MSLRTRPHARRALLALTVALAGACGDDTNALADNLVTVTNLSDYFTFSVAGLDNVSDGRSDLWSMQGDQATVDVTPGLSGGSAFLQVRDGEGEIVYAEDIESEVDGVTDVGSAGIWQVVVIFEKASGGFGFALARDTLP